MKSKPGLNKRWALWLPSLAICAWLALFGDKSPPGDAAMSLPTKVHAASSMTQPLAGVAPVVGESIFALVPRDQLFARADDKDGTQKAKARDLFSTRSWNPPPAPPPEQPVLPPAAPPVPYTFLGKKLEGDTWEVFLSKGEQTFVARTSQVIENEWRVDTIDPPTLTLTYLPLGLPRNLSIGDPR